MMVSDQDFSGKYIIIVKPILLAILAIQNSALFIVLRYSRILPGPKYLGSTVVILSEILKFTICLCIYLKKLWYQQSYTQARLPSTRTGYITDQPRPLWKQVWSDGFGAQSGFPKLILLAILYTLQNNLQFVAASYLDAVTFQVTYQCKILTTAFFAVTLLRQSLPVKRWLSLVILTAGVAVVQMPQSSFTFNQQRSDYILGMAAVGVACVCSGLAGVYLEKILKSSQTSCIWLRNIQLSVGCFGVALSGAFFYDFHAILEHGFFQNYSPIVLVLIFVQAAGGLIVALVVESTDSVLKGFATSISVILSTVASIFLFDFTLTFNLLFGSVLVLVATYLYGS